MFNKGDYVKRKDNKSFSNGEHVLIVEYIDALGHVWLKETETNLHSKFLCLANKEDILTKLLLEK